MEMVTKTVHVYPAQDTWAVKREGKPGKNYATQREAVDAARTSVKSTKSGQVVVHGKDGLIMERWAYNMTRIQDPPKESARASEIARAVSKVTLKCVQSSPSRNHSPQK